MWGNQVFFVYAPRRVECPSCGIRVEKMPWAEGKHRLTETYAWFLAGWAKRLSWQEVAVAFRTSWDHVFCSVERSVIWGRQHQDLSGIEAIGVDEIAWQRGHRYLTLVYQIDGHCKRLLWIGEKRTVKTLLRFFRWLGRRAEPGIEVYLQWHVEAVPEGDLPKRPAMLWIFWIAFILWVTWARRLMKFVRRKPES